MAEGLKAQAQALAQDTIHTGQHNTVQSRLRRRSFILKASSFVDGHTNLEHASPCSFTFSPTEAEAERPDLLLGNLTGPVHPVESVLMNSLLLHRRVVGAHQLKQRRV